MIITTILPLYPFAPLSPLEGAVLYRPFFLVKIDVKVIRNL